MEDCIVASVFDAMAELKNGFSMQAVVIREFGDLKKLKVEEVPTPEPKTDEALVAVHAASINPSDIKNVMGVMHGATLPRIPGRDFAGIVARGPTDLIGREVWGTGGDIGFTRDGSHAQYLVLPKTAVTPKPANLSMDAAASAGLTFVTAYSALVTAAAIAKGETALIIGAAGGVGSAAVQIAKSRLARVIGVVRSEADEKIARDNGADEIINSKTTDLVQAAQSLTKNRGPEVIFDTTGAMFPQCVEAAALGARIPIITAPADGKVTFNLRNVYRKLLRILGVDTRGLDAVACAKILAGMTPNFESGQFKAAPGQPRPLSQAVQAYEEASRGGVRIVLRPDLQ
jgi:NADPH:quinone reductase